MVLSGIYLYISVGHMDKIFMCYISIIGERIEDRVINDRALIHKINFHHFYKFIYMHNET